jgi:hypothetical protein
MSDPKDEAQRRLNEAAFLCPWGIYTHRKGGLYVVFAHSVDEASLVPLVHYFSLEKETRWTRTVENFLEDVEGKRRFQWVRSAWPYEMEQARSPCFRLTMRGSPR